MATFYVTQVIDGDTIDVSPAWQWNGRSGSRVRLAGVNAPELGQLGGLAAKRRLSELVDGENVDLKNPVSISYGRLVCDVISSRGINLKTVL